MSAASSALLQTNANPCHQCCDTRELARKCLAVAQPYAHFPFQTRKSSSKPKATSNTQRTNTPTDPALLQMHLSYELEERLLLQLRGVDQRRLHEQLGALVLQHCAALRRLPGLESAEHAHAPAPAVPPVQLRSD